MATGAAVGAAGGRGAELRPVPVAACSGGEGPAEGGGGGGRRSATRSALATDSADAGEGAAGGGAFPGGAFFLATSLAAGFFRAAGDADDDLVGALSETESCPRERFPGGGFATAPGRSADLTGGAGSVEAPDFERPAGGAVPWEVDRADEARFSPGDF